MRDLIITENITVDGVIDASEGWFAPGDDSGDLSDLMEVMQAQSAASDAFLTGRVTFEEMRGYWPAQIETDQTGVSKYLNEVQKYVVSSTLGDPEWENSTVLGGDMEQEVRSLKEADGADIVCTGSMQLTRGLIAAGLVDEYRLFVYPVVIGRGHRLFEDQTEVPELKLAECRAFRSGITLQRYEVG